MFNRVELCLVSDSKNNQSSDCQSVFIHDHRNSSITLHSGGRTIYLAEKMGKLNKIK
jgi:hypothetical protein